MSISEALIQREAKQYDCSVVTRLRLEKKGLRSISNLESCVSLIELSLAWNDISVIGGLESLTLLRRLDLSHNRIQQIGTGLSTLTSLQWLDLKDNLLENIDDLSQLKKLCELRSLNFQNCDGEESNPMCLQPTYNLARIRSVLPDLVTLDGGHVMVYDAFEAIELAAKEEEKTTIMTVPSEPWFDAQDLCVEDDTILLSAINGNDPSGGGSSGSSNGTSNNGSINKNKSSNDVMGTLLKGMERTDEMLTTDSVLLLRKADTLINKAKAAMK